MLNLFIAIIVSAMQSMVEEQKVQESSKIGAVVHDENLKLHQAIRDLQDEVRSLRELMQLAAIFHQ